MKSLMKLMLVTVWFTSQSVIAEDPHVHGVAHLNMAVEGSLLHVELESPAMNIVGFEHQPRSSRQREQIHQAVRKLKAVEQLLAPNREAQCRIAKKHVDAGLKPYHDDHAQEKHAEHEHSEDKHSGEKHAEREHSESKHSEKEHAAHEHVEEEHSEMTAEYQFTCKNIVALKSMTVKLFEHFPALEKIQVKFIGSDGQKAMTLTPASAVFTL